MRNRIRYTTIINVTQGVHHLILITCVGILKIHSQSALL